ncbi:MAG TPA: hypothetical protein VEK34_01730 [Methylocella sp.]|nr:hypothetical protein [Methylocella sp.]
MGNSKREDLNQHALIIVHFETRRILMRKFFRSLIFASLLSASAVADPNYWPKTNIAVSDGVTGSFEGVVPIPNQACFTPITIPPRSYVKGIGIAFTQPGVVGDMINLAIYTAPPPNEYAYNLQLATGQVQIPVFTPTVYQPNPYTPTPIYGNVPNMLVVSFPATWQNESTTTFWLGYQVNNGRGV